MNKRGLVFISLESWDDIWRRNQFVCAELAVRGYEILFVQPSKDWSAGLRRGDWAQFASEPRWSPPGLKNVSIIRPVKIAPKSMLLGRVANAALRKRLILAELRRIGWRDPVLWINDHGAGHLAGQLSESAVIYDITDDWTACESNPRYRKVIEKQDRTLCDKADVVMVCSEHLHNLKRRFVPQERLHLVLNGVHAEHYSRVLKDEESLPEVAASCASPFWGIPEPFIPTGLTWNSCESWPEHRASERSLSSGPIIFAHPTSNDCNCRT